MKATGIVMRWAPELTAGACPACATLVMLDAGEPYLHAAPVFGAAGGPVCDACARAAVPRLWATLRLVKRRRAEETADGH